MFYEDFEQLLNMIKGSYKKFKCYYYYNKTILFFKTKIALFESDEEEMESIFIQIAENIVAQNNEYFNKLISKINFYVMPKNFKSHDTDVINDNVDIKKSLETINFFIDAPIELLILDMLWSLLIGKLAYKNKKTPPNSYANKIRKQVLNVNNDSLDSIDFDSNRSFYPYYNLYSSWRNNAFEVIQQKKNDQAVILYCLDIKGFYYNVKFQFSTLPELLNNDITLNLLSYLTTLIELIYKKYSNMIKRYRKGISLERDECLFPIGLISPMVLTNIYMKNFDDCVRSIKPLYYGRYVDDILLVMSNDSINQDKSFYINLLINAGILKRIDKNTIALSTHNNLHIQQEKVNCFLFGKDTPPAIIEIYNNLIRINSSEVNLLPDSDLLRTSFNQNAYILDNLDRTNKIRELGFISSNNYKATVYITNLLRLIKNINVDELKVDKNLNRRLNDILEFYKESQALEFCTTWVNVFNILTIADNRTVSNEFYMRIKNAIENIDSENIKDIRIGKTYDKIVLRLKKCLKEYLDIAICQAAALNLKIVRPSKLKETAFMLRKSNMFQHNLTAFPLINYTHVADDKSFSLLNNDISMFLQRKPDVLKSDAFKLKWSPRFINRSELFVYNFLYRIGQGGNPHINNIKKIYDSYNECNHLTVDYNVSETIESQKESKIYNQILNICTNHQKKKDKIKVAIANINYCENDCINVLDNPNANQTVAKKERLFKLLRTAFEEKAKFVIFPEFYLPIAWLLDVVSFSMKTQITIITGIEYIKNCNKAYNYVSLIQPYMQGRFKDIFVICREKNFYSPHEKLGLSYYGLLCEDQKNPNYQIVNNGLFTYSFMLCFEITDIISRANLKSKTNMLFIPEFNKDTIYFESIVKSASRDLHCFMVQANTSLYGDSRISAPYKSEISDIINIKGGDNDTIMIGSIEMQSLLDFQATYYSNLNNEIQKNISNYKRKKRNNNKTQKKSKIKPLPPRF